MEVEVIKANNQFDEGSAVARKNRLRVAAYCRVSTNDEDQIKSYNSMVTYYTDLIKKNPMWDFAGVYADKASTGTKAETREMFQQLIADCLADKIDMIVAKSLSRFARNTLDTLKYVRMLRERKIAVYFEVEKINTMKDGEFLLTILSSVAQQEVENTSAYVKKGLKMRMKRGEMVGFQGCMGYDYDYKTKTLSINEEGAKIVRYIFERYAEGAGSTMIARELNERGAVTLRGNQWTTSAVMDIIDNEKYTGDLLMGKTFTVDPISKRRLDNLGEEDRFFVKDHHEPIISHELFDKVHDIKNRRNGGRKRGVGPGKREKFSRQFAFSCLLECGFCGANLSRRRWHSSSKYKKTIWQCVKSTKGGKRYCPDSKGIPEEVLEEAFVESYRLLTADNKNVMTEFLKRMEDELGDDAVQNRFEVARREVFVVSEKRKRLLEKYVDGGVEKDVYESMDRELQKKLREAEEELEKSEEQLDNKESIQRRIAEFKRTLSENEVLTSFDRAVFESVIEKVIVGGYDDEGNKDPYKVTFIYKNGFKDGMPGAKERFAPKNGKSDENVCSDMDIQADDVCSDTGNSACRDSLSLELHERMRYPMKLSPFEMSMYLAQMLDPESTEYSVNSYFEIKGAGEEKVERAVRKMVENRECLRSYYGEQNGEPVRILTDEVPSIRWETAGSEEEVRERATASLPAFDLKTVPARFIGYKLPDGKIILNLQIHHIAIDGRSTMLFTQELFDRLCGHPVAAAPDLSERSLEADDYETGKAFYHSLFPDGIPVAEMPLKGQRPKDHPGADKQLTLPFDREEFAKISSAAKSYGVTTFSVLLSALSITLGMYCGSEDLVIGFPVDMRREEEKTMTGMFVNTGIIRVKPEGSRPVGEFVKEVAQLLRDCSRNRPLPMAEFIREFGVSTDSSRNPVFDVGVNNFFHPEPLTEGDLSVTFNYDLQTLKRDMNVTMHRFGDSMTMVVQYASKLYEANLMNRFLEQYRYTLSLLCEGCDTVAEAERLVPSHMEIYERVNRTEVPVELMSVNKLFEHQVSLHPDKTAVIAAGESLTFGELNCLANRVAHTLVGLGVGKDSIVGMVLDRTKEVFIAEHGILKSGGAFLPMVPEYPDDRIRYCLLNAESPCVITTEAIKAERPELFSDEQPYKTLTVESMTSAGNDENPNLDIDLDSLAYCIYTSGSTGNPKGVMIEHRNMCNYLNANPMHPAIYWHTQDIGTALSVTSISFDMSITERFVTLCNGVTLCMATLDEIHNPMALAKLMTKHHTESIVCTPSYLSSLLEVPEMREPIAALKAYHVGGEAFPSTLIARLKELNPNSHVMNGYGPTETSVCCTSSEILPGQPITIGKPEANVTHYVMDKQKRIVPPGVSGELIICGAGVGRGYVKLPDRTAASFFTCLGQKAYHSGDLVRLNEYGEYDYFGRMDNQVKLRGLRIELDEIENVMLEYPGVKLSKVIVCNNGKEDYLAGYYTAENEVPVPELRAFLKGRLTPYMVPDAMLQLDKMPLTVNGKIDKKQLPDIADAAEEREYEAPVGAMEEKICSYFAKVLNQERISATDNFFEIGGTSLSVALIVSTAIHDGLDLVYKNVFEYPTPRMLAKYLETKMGDAAKVEAAAAQESGADETAKTDAAPADKVAQTAGSVKYESILSKNCVGNLAGIKTGRLGNVLLTGATGFLGIHVLCELLHSDAVDHIVCLARKRHSIAPETRINHYLMYYFNDLFTDLMEKKVQIIDADITDEDLAEHLKDVPCDVIINCAAMVKHFETGNLIHKINTEGVVHLIELALAVNARLVQVSTLSIAGQVDSDLLDEIILKETDFEIGQRTDTNKYVESKYDAEAAIYDAMEQRGLKAKVIRIGNLMGRRSDGEFQMNFNTNGFVNRLKAYRVLGCFPVSRMDEPVEFSPVDMTAKAVVTLAGTPDEFSVFHANNCHNIHFANVLEAFEECGYHIDVVDDETFSKRFSEALYDETKSLYVSSLIAYADNENKTLQWTLSDNTYTVKALYRLGFSWPVISPVYVRKHLEALATLGFFDPEE